MKIAGTVAVVTGLVITGVSLRKGWDFGSPTDPLLLAVGTLIVTLFAAGFILLWAEGDGMGNRESGDGVDLGTVDASPPSPSPAPPEPPQGISPVPPPP